MKSWQRWVQAPQTHLFRRILFQMHLWAGIGLGLYVLTISVTGSAILLQSPISQIFVPSKIEPSDAIALSGQELRDKMAEAYEGYEVYFVVPASGPDRATYVVLNKDGGVFPRYFNQYTLEDQGVSNPWPVRTFEFLVNVHDDLLMGTDGRKINGIGGGLFLLMVFSGITIWWQGRMRWKESLLIRRNNPRGFNWQLHSFIGFWSLLLMFAWGLTGLYLGFPRPFNYVMSLFDQDLTDFERPDAWLRFLLDIHYARFGDSVWSRWTWITISLLPSIMVVSGFIIWWKRVILKPRKSS
jgi:uncharacterized iron-regulated membrane protein